VNRAILQALAVTCELTQTQLSPAAARVMAQDLARYPEPQVLGALDRCRKELRPRELTLSAILTRLDDGRPGPEEAWAIVSPALADERITIVWTEEMALASAPASAIIDDPVAARMAFLESYRRLVQRARDDGEEVKWTPALGWDAGGREGPLLEAVRRGRLTAQHVAGLLPHREEPVPEVVKLIPEFTKLLAQPEEA
jgi:hypothetical protein